MLMHVRPQGLTGVIEASRHCSGGFAAVRQRIRDPSAHIRPYDNGLRTDGRQLATLFPEFEVFRIGDGIGRQSRSPICARDKGLPREWHCERSCPSTNRAIGFN